jgi:hypothetical protein
MEFDHVGFMEFDHVTNRYLYPDRYIKLIPYILINGCQASIKMTV